MAAFCNWTIIGNRRSNFMKRGMMILLAIVFGAFVCIVAVIVPMTNTQATPASTILVNQSPSFFYRLFVVNFAFEYSMA